MGFLDSPLQSILLRPSRMIGDIQVQVIINENTTDTLTVTKQPVQQGASITDHSFVEPVTFQHTIYFAAPQITGGDSLPAIYQKLLTLQSARVPFTIVTPKRTYKNMLLTSLSQTTDARSENNLAINASYQEVILVPVLATLVPDRPKQKNPGSTGATIDSGNKSMITKGVDLVKNLFK